MLILGSEIRKLGRAIELRPPAISPVGAGAANIVGDAAATAPSSAGSSSAGAAAAGAASAGAAFAGAASAHDPLDLNGLNNLWQLVSPHDWPFAETGYRKAAKAKTKVAFLLAE